MYRSRLVPFADDATGVGPAHCVRFKGFEKHWAFFKHGHGTLKTSVHLIANLSESWALF